jgi:hypothetical protein
MILLFLLIISTFTILDANLFVNISGDVILGALFPIHRKGVGTENCGKIQVRCSFIQDNK